MGQNAQMNSRRVAPLFAVALIVAACSSDGSESESVDDSPVTTDADEAAVSDSTEPTPTEADEVEAVDDDGDDADGDDAESEAAGEPAAGGEAMSVTVEPSPHISIAAMVTVTAAEPMQISLSASGADHEVAVPLTAEAATEHQIPLVGMRADDTYVIDVTAVGEDGESVVTSDAAEFTTGSLPDYFAEHDLTIDAERAAPGYTIIEFDSLRTPEGASSSQYLAAYDNEGEIVWYYTNTGALAGVEPTPAGTFNMFYWPFGIREVDVLGNVLNNWRPQPRGVEVEEVDDEFVVTAPDPDQVERQGGIAALVGNPGDAQPTPVVNDWIDLVTVHHESWPMPNGNVLTLSTTVHELTPEQRARFCPGDESEFNAISDVAVEFTPEGDVVRTWDLWDAIDIDEHPGQELCVDAGIFAGENTRDWNHANSVTYDPERDAIIISSRHTNQIVAFDHLDDEGPQSQVRWIIGDGATIIEGGDHLPLDGEQTYYQHAVEVNEDGSLIVYDNGNARPGATLVNAGAPPTACTSVINCPGAYSRAVIYDVDDSSDDRAEWTATQRWEHIDTDSSGELVYSSFISDADMMSNGNVLVTHGGVGTFPPVPEDPLRILIREVVPDGASGGEVVWELNGAPGYVTYRAERVPSFYFGPEWVQS